MKNRLTLSVVVPIFNEEESVCQLYQVIRDVCEGLGVSYEIVLVDDGSQDNTFELLQDFHRQDSHVKVIRFRKNYGQTAAMAAGFRLARGETIVSMDGDLQNDPRDIPRLLEKIEEGYDVVCGWRKDRKDTFFSRRLPSLVANWIIGKITGVLIHDNGCSLKAYRTSVMRRVALYSEFHRFIPAMASLVGAQVTEIVVNHHPRQFGTSKYGISRVWKVFLDLFIVKMLLGFSAKPALWFGILSFPGFVLGMICLIGMASSLGSGAMLGAAAFLFLSLSGSLMVLGLIGEMVFYTGDYRPEEWADTSFFIKFRNRDAESRHTTLT